VPSNLAKISYWLGLAFNPVVCKKLEEHVKKENYLEEYGHRCIPIVLFGKVRISESCEITI
jgi:hypothetical protein